MLEKLPGNAVEIDLKNKMETFIVAHYVCTAYGHNTNIIGGHVYKSFPVPYS